MAIEVSARREGELRCVFCREELTGGIETCPGCGATCHPACRAEMSRCATIGCSGVRAEGGASPRPRASSRRARLADVAEPERSRAHPRERPPRASDSSPDDGVQRPRTPAEHVLWSAAGASVGVLIGVFVAFGFSRHGIETSLAVRCCSIGLVLGALEGAFIGALGVRSQPRFPGDSESSPTVVLVTLLLVPCAVVGEVFARQLHAPSAAGGVAAVLLVLPLLLRWLGFG
jgi:hypothetical protein